MFKRMFIFLIFGTYRATNIQQKNACIELSFSLCTHTGQESRVSLLSPSVIHRPPTLAWTH